MYTNGGNDEDGYEENDKGEGMYTNGEFVEDGDEECGEGENDKGEGMCGMIFSSGLLLHTSCTDMMNP